MKISNIEVLSFDGLKLRGFLHKVKANPESAPTIIFTHGISEYALRHDYLISHLGNDHNILFHDLRGHGLSEGSRGYINHFKDFEKDLLAWTHHCSSKLDLSGDKHLMGHSMGGLITLGALESTDISSMVKSIFLSAPAIGVGDPLGVFVQKYIHSSVIALLGKVLHKVPLKGRVDTDQLSHSKSLKDLYENDPMILNSLSARLLTQLLVRSKFISKFQYSFTNPIRIVVGSADKIISVDQIYKFAKRADIESDLLTITDALHEVHFETTPFRDKFLDELRGFFS